MGLGNIIRFILTGDNTSAVRAIREVGDTAEVTSKRVEASNDEQVASFEEVKGATESLRSSVIGLAGIAGLGGLAFGFKDVIEAGIKWRADQAQLQSSLRTTGAYSVAMMNSINTATAKSATHGGFSDVTESAGISQFLTQLGSVKGALAANTAVVDVARSLNIGYAQALTIVARAQVGTTGRLQQYLGAIVPVTTHVDSLTAAEKRLYPQMLVNAKLEDKRATAMMVNQLILQKMGNATSVYGKTTEGAISNAENSFQLLTQFIGSKALPTIKSVANWLANAAFAVMNHWPQISGVIRAAFAPLSTVIRWLGGIKGLAIAVGVALGEWVTYVSILKGMAVATALWSTAMKSLAVYEAYVSVGMGGMTAAWATFTTALDDSPIGLLALALTGVAVAATLLIYHFKAVERFLTGAFNTALDFVKQHWQLMLIVITGGIAAIPLFVANHFNQIISFIASMPGRIATVAVHMWDGLKTGLISVANWIIRFINSTFGTVSLPFGLGSIHLFTIGQIGQGTSTTPASGLGTASGAGQHLPYTPPRTLGSAVPSPRMTPSAKHPSGSGPIHLRSDAHTTITLDSRVLAEGVTQHALEKAAVS